MKSQRPILLVEDDRVDAMTVKRALKELKVTNRLCVVGNGEEAVAFLQEARNEKPCIILLDVNMPKMNGIEFLTVIKRDDSLKTIPVVMLTTSRADQDRIGSFALGVAGYMLKPVDYLQFMETMRAISLYWTLSELPE